MPSMMVKPENMEFVDKIAKDRELSKEEALDVVVRAGIHRMKATINYQKSHRAAPKAKKAAKAPKAKKAAKAPKAKKAKATKSSLLD